MTKVSTLKQEGKLSHSIKVETDSETFNIPVIDVRDGENERKSVNAIIKQDNIRNGNGYFKQSFSFYGYSYNLSMKGRRQ